MWIIGWILKVLYKLRSGCRITRSDTDNAVSAATRSTEKEVPTDTPVSPPKEKFFVRLNLPNATEGSAALAQEFVDRITADGRLKPFVWREGIGFAPNLIWIERVNTR